MMRPLILALLLVIVSSRLSAQHPLPIQELIDNAQAALNNLDPGKAAAIARSLLEIGDEGHPDITTAALELMVASLYPEDVRLQRRDSATAYARRLILSRPNADIPRSMSWPGLDSLFDEIRRTTRAVWVSPDSIYVMQGTSSQITFPVRTSHPATLYLAFVPRDGGPPILLDSTRSTAAANVTLQLFDGDVQRLGSGAYEMQVISVDSVSGTTVLRRYDVVLDAPPLNLSNRPTSLDSSALLPERSRPRPLKNAILGLTLGVATGVFASTIQGDHPVKSVSIGGRHLIVGSVVALGSAIGALLDIGRPLPQNVEHNAGTRAQFVDAVRATETENASKRSRYMATLTVLRGNQQ